MANADDFDDRARKERSPSYPFISLPKALERAKAFDEAHRRNPARLASVAETWGYSSSSSGLLQTASALKAYGLLEDNGRGGDRKTQLTDLAQRILHDTRPGMREAAIREAALRPRLFAEYTEKWLPERPSDSHCLSELRLDRGFTEAAASMFLRSFDETVTFSGLKDGDGLSISLEDDDRSETVNLNRAHTAIQRVVPPMTGLVQRGTRGGMPVYHSGPGQGPSYEMQQNQPLPRATLPLPEGIVALEIPSDLSRKSFEALKSWVNLMVTLAEPVQGELTGHLPTEDLK
jgi:hypothetical protein